MKQSAWVAFARDVVGDTNAFAVGVIEGLELNDVGVVDNAHNLKLTVLANSLSIHVVSTKYRDRNTLKRLSCSTRLMAASSPDGESFVWKTTPNEPLPTILHWVYWISFVSPVTPS